MDDFQALLNEISRHQVAAGDSEPSNYEKFLDAILKGKHPPFCELVWTGEAFHIVLQLHFQRAPQIAGALEPRAEAYRRKAWRSFRKVRPDKQRLMQIRVTIKDYLPVTAEISVAPEAAGLFRLETTQLTEFQNP
ncbi:MAG: hypothetical protein HS126_40405 [Anaerolineales bacterium]|nr:hypothetical protein [Anaerolineales bacterium]